MGAKSCFMCESLAKQWVLWANWRGDLRHFCENDCLRRWLECCLGEASVDAIDAREEEEQCPRRSITASTMMETTPQRKGAPY
jgi:hypothetical protein